MEFKVRNRWRKNRNDWYVTFFGIRYQRGNDYGRDLNLRFVTIAVFNFEFTLSWDSK